MRIAVAAVTVALLAISCSTKRPIESPPLLPPPGGDGKLDDSTSKIDKACSPDQQHVVGDFCPTVEQTCVEWLDADTSPSANGGMGPLRCARFSSSKCTSKTWVHLDFCMDTYEWPNKKGELPPIGGTWYDAKQQCESIGKRLCTAREWTFACEGPDVKPYPYGDGLHRDDTACNIDKPSMDPSTPRSEWPQHYRAAPSGQMDRCVSWAGVHDMTGNVDEWVNNVGGRSDGDPYFSGLKGGYWGPVRTRCRPMTTVHGPGFSFYQIGFRCCSDSQKQ